MDIKTNMTMEERNSEIIECKTGKSAYEYCLEGDEAKNNKDYYNAIISYQKAFKTIDEESVKYLVAKVTCCYRRINRPQTAVNFYIKAKEKYGDKAVDHVVLTSVSGAYGDLKKWDEALECANYACALNEGEITSYLEAVFNRIDYNTKKLH